jgi:hypothetical protein
MNLYIFSPLLVLIIETACVFCEVYAETEETSFVIEKMCFLRGVG